MAMMMGMDDTLDTNALACAGWANCGPIHLPYLILWCLPLHRPVRAPVS